VTRRPRRRRDSTRPKAPHAGGRQRPAKKRWTQRPAEATIKGRVTLSPSLAAKAAPTDTVFILARALEGPRMPLAILKRR
jgi:cytochrome c-type biogenesis protein CcmH